MKIKIYNNISNTERHIYEFYVGPTHDGNLRYDYHGYWVSRRDDLHPWGDTWADFYRDQKRRERRILENEVIKENGYEYDGWDNGGDDCLEWDDKFSALDHKYNPVTQRTTKNCTFLYGRTGGNLPHPPFSDQHIIQMLNEQLTIAMTDAKLCL